MSHKLEGKVAVITGGSSGIGLATAREFVAEGAYVFITGRRQSELDKAVREIGNNVRPVQGDVASMEDLDHLYEVVGHEKGHIDIIFANAAVGGMAPEGLTHHRNTMTGFSKSTPAVCSSPCRRGLSCSTTAHPLF